jgi:hypothetical protein
LIRGLPGIDPGILGGTAQYRQRSGVQSSCAQSRQACHKVTSRNGQLHSSPNTAVTPGVAAPQFSLF